MLLYGDLSYVNSELIEIIEKPVRNTIGDNFPEFQLFNSVL